MYYLYGKINRGVRICPLYGGCPLFGGSAIRGFTVALIILLILISGFHAGAMIVYFIDISSTLDVYSSIS